MNKLYDTLTYVGIVLAIVLVVVAAVFAKPLILYGDPRCAFVRCVVVVP